MHIFIYLHITFHLHSCIDKLLTAITPPGSDFALLPHITFAFCNILL